MEPCFHFFQYIPGENLRDQAHILVAGNHPVIVYGDTAAFLSPVLERVKGVVGFR